MRTELGIFLINLYCLVGAGCNSSSGNDPMPADKVKAFPQAQGGGAYATGGRNGGIAYVTSLSDNLNDEGTLRAALRQATTRIVIFKVSGRIDLNSPLKIERGNVTIAGQTAPGDGICVSGYPVIVQADNVIIRFMHFRMGDLKKAEGDALTIEKGHKNILIDHCSCSWSTDECVSMYGVENATVQYCIISESLNNSVHVKGAHGYAGIWGGKNTTFHHNLLAHHKSRMPRFDHDYVTRTNVGPTDFINNVVYNWYSNSAYGGESDASSGNQRQYNFIANYYKPGPATKSGVRTRLLNPTTKCGNCGSSVTPGKFYIVGNIMDGSSAVTADNWSGVYPDDPNKKSQCRSNTRFTLTSPMTTEETAEQAYETVLAKVGCSLKRDAIDTRIVDEVRKGSYTYSGSNKDAEEKSINGLIDTPSDVGGWPAYNSTEYPMDTDGDGMPDAWEIEHGLDPNSFADGKATTVDPPYTNIEVYLNSLVAHLY